MKIEKIKARHWDTFSATFVCVHCGYRKEGGGMDAGDYLTDHDIEINCPECHKTTPWRPYERKCE